MVIRKVCLYIQQVTVTVRKELFLPTEDGMFLFLEFNTIFFGVLQENIHCM